MKKIICILLVLLMFTAAFSGCAREPGTLQILVDLGSVDTSYVEAALTDLKSFVVNTAEIPEEDFVFECLPLKGPERETVLERIRTEIMSGEGPNLFIVQTHSSLWEPLLFEMPEKAMELGFFLPLDEYIANAEYAEWDKFTPTIMEIGRNEEGQLLIPLAYELPSAVYRKEDISHTPTNMTWEELKSEEDLQDAVQRLGAGLPPTGPWDGPYDFPIDYLMSTSYQCNSQLFRRFVYAAIGDPGMPVHGELMSEQFVVKGTEGHNDWFSLTPENFEAVSAVREQITGVQIYGSLNDTLEKMMYECYQAYKNGEDYTQTVHEAYAVLRQMMAE